MSRITDAKEVILTSDSTGESWVAGVWDPRNGSLLSTFRNRSVLGHRTLHLLSDSYVLAANATKPYLHVWPLNNPSPLPNVRLTTPGKVNALTCTPNGSYIITAVSEKLYIWQTCSGTLLNTLNRHYQTITCLNTTKDGSLFASAGEDGLLFVWSLYSVLNEKPCSPLHSFSDNSLPIKDLCFGHGDARARLYTVSLDRKANIYELGSGALLVSLICDVPLTAVAVNISDSQLFIGCTTGDILYRNLHEPLREIEQNLWVQNGEEQKNVLRAHKSSVTALSVSVDCRTLVSGSTDAAVHVWDIASRQVLRTMEHKGPVTAAFFARGYENFYTSTFKPGLEINNFETILDNVDKQNSLENVIQIISRGRNPAEILDFESYVEDSTDSQGSEKIRKEMENMKQEIKRLKAINANLFKYSVTHIFDNIGKCAESPHKNQV